MNIVCSYHSVTNFEQWTRVRANSIENEWENRIRRVSGTPVYMRHMRVFAIFNVNRSENRSTWHGRHFESTLVGDKVTSTWRKFTSRIRTVLINRSECGRMGNDLLWRYASWLPARETSDGQSPSHEISWHHHIAIGPILNCLFSSFRCYSVDTMVRQPQKRWSKRMNREFRWHVHVLGV